MSINSQIVHESETQRQFIRLQLPSTVILNGSHYTVKDLSSGGLAIRGIASEVKMGESFDIVLILPFENFALDINLSVEVRYSDKKNDVTGCRFTDLNTDQISILSHIVKSYMSGDFVNANDIIHVVSRETFVNIRKNNTNQNQTFLSKIKNVSIYLFVIFAILGLSTFIVRNILDNLFVITAPQAQIYASSITLKNPVAGVYERTLQDGIKTVKKDQIIARIQYKDSSTNLKQYTNIVSPCDCFIEQENALENVYQSQDDILLTLLPQDQPPAIKVTIDFETAHRIKIGTSAIASVTGLKENVKGSVSKIIVTPETNSPLPQNQATVFIAPLQKLPLDLINTPAFVEFHL